MSYKAAAMVSENQAQIRPLSRIQTARKTPGKAALTLQATDQVAASEKKQPEIDTNRLILEHRENGRKLARSLLRRWRARLNAEEIDSLVDLTLCEAAKRFSPIHGASFMTFMFYHLRGYLVRAVASAMNANNVLLAFNPGPGTDIIDAANLEGDAYKSFLPECASFGLHEIEGPENILLRKEKIDSCRSACSKLDELEQEVLIRSYEREESLVDIARELGYSRCHISRVKKRALERLESFLGMTAESTAAKEPQTLILAARNAAKARKTSRRRGRKAAHRSVSVEETQVSRRAA